MYPQGKLDELDRAKTELRQRIARQRAECAEAAARATRPLGWIDTAWSLWRGLAPLAKAAVLPLGAIAARTAARPGLFRTILRWAPPVLGAVSAFRRMRRSSPVSPAAV
jgi:hypothetical protein